MKANIYLPLSLSLSLSLRSRQPHIIHHFAFNLMNKSTVCHVYLYALVLNAIFFLSLQTPDTPKYSVRKKGRTFLFVVGLFRSVSESVCV